jgi:hypothetical protein
LARYFCVVQFLSPFLSYFSYFSLSSFSLFIEQLTSVYLTRFDKGRKHLKGEGQKKGGGNSLFHYQASSLLPGLRFYLGNFSLESRVSPQQHSSSLGEKGKLIFISFRVN